MELLVGLVAAEPPALGMKEDSWGRFNKHVGDCFVTVELRRMPEVHFYVWPPIRFQPP